MVNGNKKLFSILTMVIALSMFLMACGDGNSNDGNTSSGGNNNEGNDEVVEETNYPERNITFIMPSSTGGSHDQFPRAMFNIWSEKLPNSVEFIPSNRPGELTIGITGVNNAEPDGYTIGNANIPGMITPVLLGTAQYDLEELTWIGRITSQAYVTAVSADSDVESIEEFMNSGSSHTVGISGGMSSTSGLSSEIYGDILGIDFNQVNHDTSQDAAVATIRGDLDAVHMPYATLRGFIESGELKPIIIFTPEKMEEHPNVVIPEDIGHPELADIVGMQILYFGPPNMPDDVTELLRDSFMEAANDPEYLAWAEEAGREVVPLHGSEVQAVVNTMLENFSEYRELLED